MGLISNCLDLWVTVQADKKFRMCVAIFAPVKGAWPRVSCWHLDLAVLRHHTSTVFMTTGTEANSVRGISNTKQAVVQQKNEVENGPWWSYDDYYKIVTGYHWK